MDLLTKWLRSYLPELPVDDAQLAEDLTLRGIAVEGVFAAACGGSRFEMDLTTNRVDAMNHYGVAREAATIYDLPLRSLTADLPLARLEAGLGAPVEATPAGAGFPVRIEAEEMCGRFTARVVRGVTVGAATGEMAAYFAALGQKGISGPVDATNYGWLAMGQPTHVFDLDTIEGGIVVRRARAGERLRLLDGSERTLTAEDLVVADERKALGLAGVMGGWESRVTEATKNILVEAAWFDPGAIRASSRRHGLHTDASHRFERGADFGAAAVANALVTRLVMAQAGGAVAGPLTDAVVPAVAARTAERRPVRLRVSEVGRLLGATMDGAAIGEELVARYLTGLGCGLEAAGVGEFEVRLPSWRLDLEREVDLVEEVARVYGYNRFADTLPGWAGAVREPVDRAQERAARGTLRALGYTEAISSTFAAAEAAAVFGEAGAGVVAAENPLSEEAGVLRPSLVGGMAGMVARNLARDAGAVRLFEMGTVFTGSAVKVQERVGLALGAAGGAAAGALYRGEDALLYEVKGAVERLLGRFAGGVGFAAGPLPGWVEPGRGAVVLLGGERVGVFGELSAAESAARKLRERCVLAELDATRLLETPLRGAVLKELSRFQAVERDFSFVFPDAVTWGAVEAAVRGAGGAALQAVVPVEIFRDAKGKAVAVGSYSLLTRVVFQSLEGTLMEEAIGGWSGRIAEGLRDLGGVQRV